MARVPQTTIIYPFGDTFDEFTVQWLKPNGSPHDITNWTARMQIRDAAGTQHLELTSAASTLVIDGPAGRVTADGSAAFMQTGTLVEGVAYLFDVEITSDDVTPIVRTILSGKFWVDKEVTA